MKKLLIILLVTLQVSAQETEFKTYKNGLIYSENTISQLTHIVDSLNLQYSTCELNKTYYAKPQTIAHFIEIKHKDSKEAIQDLKNEMSFDDFIKKHQPEEVLKNKLITKFRYNNYKNEPTVSFKLISPKRSYRYHELNFTENLAQYNKNLKNKWIFQYNKNNDLLAAIYFPNTLKAKALPNSYARKIGYSNCLIDTTAVKFLKSAKRGWVELPEKWQELSLTKKKSLLTKLRNTKVYGSCSMDSSPREHALRIALLSAETIDWKVFMRAHLDILNDYFDRASDGSYAQAGRKTYLKELETIGINVPDLIMGITFRVENNPKNHYYGSISRMGRAITEAKEREKIATEILAIINNKNLDDYNRYLFYFLYANYVAHLKDSKIQAIAKAELKLAKKNLPQYLFQ